MRLVYSLTWYLLLLPLCIVFFTKMLLAKDGYTRDRLSRFSWFRPTLTSTDLLWHCVSVGEVVSVTPLIKALLASNPRLTITITTTTATGAEQVRSTFNDRIQHCYLPYDCGWFMRRLLDRIKPKVVLITEVELWPNLINIANARNIDVVLINARMTNRSTLGYARLGRFFTGTAEQIRWISAQGEADKNNYQRLGVSLEQIINNGNIKFELSETDQSDPQLNDLATSAKQQQKLIIIAASTHAPEESMMILAHQQLIAAGANIETWIVPRHPQRFEQVADLLAKADANFCRYSQLPNCLTEDTTSRIVLIDVMGMLNAAFALSDIAFVGGSFAEKGGHNALEAALYKLPVVMGPSQFNNPMIYQQLSEIGNLITVQNQGELESTLKNWCENPTQRALAGEQGFNIIRQNRGALAANKALIETLI